MKSYKRQRYLFFWLSIIVYFVPYVSVTAALLPFMTASQGLKWGIGLAVVALNAIPFIKGIFHSFFAHFPFVNLLAIVFVLVGGFFTMSVFSEHVYTFLTIEAVAAAGSIVACVLWGFHRKYKRQSQTVSTVLKSGVLEEKKDD